MTAKKPSFNVSMLYVLGFLLLAGGLSVFYYLLDWPLGVCLTACLAVVALHGVSLVLALNRKRVVARLEREKIAEDNNLLQVDITKLRVNIEASRKKLKDFTKLRFLIEQLSRSFTLEQTARTFALEVHRFFDRMNVRTFAYLFHPQTGELMFQSAEGGRPKNAAHIGRDNVFDRWVLKNQQPLVIADARNDYRFNTETDVSADINEARSLMVIPLKSAHQIYGILRLESETPNFFDTNDLRLFVTAGELGAVAVQNARFYEQLVEISVKDGLTGLFLRRHFLFHLEKELSKKIYLTTGLSLIMIDLDHFKMCNDKYGHMAGDIILKWMGEFLNAFCRERGLLACRFGGEEFCVLVPHAREPMAAEIAEKIRFLVEKHQFHIRRNTFNMTISVGVATLPDHARTQQELIHQADQAMYVSKKQGRNRVTSAEKT